MPELGSQSSLLGQRLYTNGNRFHNSFLTENVMFRNDAKKQNSFRKAVSVFDSLCGRKNSCRIAPGVACFPQRARTWLKRSVQIKKHGLLFGYDVIVPPLNSI